jgi:hypothetical protein
MESVSPDKSDETADALPAREMSEAEQMQLEARYFADPQMFAELCSWRNHLIDSYVAGEVSTSLRERFEAGIEKSWAMNERIRFAETLQEAVDARGAGAVSRRHITATGSLRAFAANHRLAILAGALLLLLGAGWIAIRIRNHRTAANNEEDSLQTSSPSRSSPEPGASLSLELAQTRPRSRKTMLLVTRPQVARSASDATREILVPQNTVIVHLLLMVNGPQNLVYRGVLTTLEGARVFETGQLKAHANGTGSAAELFVPANQLPDGDYVVRLSSVAADKKMAGAGDYYFRVRKR